MRRLLAGIMLIAFNCVVILAQQEENQTLTPRSLTPPRSNQTMRAPVDVSLPVTHPDDSSLRILAPRFAFGGSQPDDRTVHPSGQSAKQEPLFVLLDGELFMILPGARLRAPDSAGEASDGAKLGFPERTKNLKESVARFDVEGKQKRH